MREFTFISRFNQLQFNTRINAFDVNHNPRCTFCKITKIIDNNGDARESFNHTFFSSPITRYFLQQIINELKSAPNIL